MTVNATATAMLNSNPVWNTSGARSPISDEPAPDPKPKSPANMAVPRAHPK